jgi:hypothetical protein
VAVNWESIPLVDDGRVHRVRVVTGDVAERVKASAQAGGSRTRVV